MATWSRCAKLRPGRSSDTSVGQIERKYYITDHSDGISRAALLQHEPPPAGDNVVALPDAR
jgi:hypothetical protein